MRTNSLDRIALRSLERRVHRQKHGLPVLRYLVETATEVPPVSVTLRIMNRRTRLLGLDAPTKLEFKEVDQLMVNAICDAMAVGDPNGTAAFNAWTDGRKSVIGAFLELVGRDRPTVLCTAGDIAGMEKPELEKAAQGLLTSEELTEIRGRAVEIKAETEGP